MFAKFVELENVHVASPDPCVFRHNLQTHTIVLGAGACCGGFGCNVVEQAKGLGATRQRHL